SRSVLAGAQVALSLVLVTIATFAYQIFRRELVDGPGFRTSRIAKMTIDAGQAHYTDAQATRFFERVLQDARQVPGVRSAAVNSAMPLFSIVLTSFVPEGFQLPQGQTSARACVNSVDESYFDTMAIPLLAGRPFRQSDAAGARPVAI